MTTIGTSRFGTGSLAASLTGLLTLTADAINLAASLDPGPGGISSVLEPVFAAANLIWFLLGLISSRADRSREGAAGLHLSWAPLVVVLALLAAYQPRLAASLVQRLAGLVLSIFNALADMITLLVG